MTPTASKSLFEKLCAAGARLSVLPRALGLAWRAAPGWSSASILLTVVQGVLPVAFIWLTRDLINRLSAKPFDGLENLDWPAVGPSLLLLGLVLLAIEALHPLARWIREAQSEHVELHVRDLVQTQANRADLAFFERPEFHDQLYRAGPEAGAHANSLLDSLALILKSTITLAALAVILVPYAWWLPLALAASLCPALGVVVYDAWRQGDWWRASTRDERRANYLNWLITSGTNAAELRLHQLGSHLQDQHRDLQQKLAAGRLSLERRHAVAAVLAAAFGIAVAAGALALLAVSSNQRAIALGDIVLIFQAFYQSQSAAKSLLSQFGALIRQSVQLQSFFDYLEGSPELVAAGDRHPAPPVLRAGIRFDNVVFSYPGNREPTISNLSASFPAGKVTAIVGANGSGKTTLIKLLCRLYDPEAGAIYLDDDDIRGHDPQRYREQFAVLLQEPLELQDTVNENIRVGRIDSVENLSEKIQAAARATGADGFIRSLEHGYDSPLGRWFADGTDLSTGQWQRLGLTRAMFRDAPVLVLDEPTAAMDAITEAQWVGQLPAMAENKTVILITHRLAAARSADRILVLEQGSLIETGTHDELLAREGTYASLYAAQASHFV